MCFPRKPSLGRYNTPRRQWTAEYRAARVRHREGKGPDPATKGTEWKAQLIVAFDRSEVCDPLTIPAAGRLQAMREVAAVLAER